MSVAVGARLHRGAVPAAAMSSRSHSPFRHLVVGRISTRTSGAKAQEYRAIFTSQRKPRCPNVKKVKKGKEIPGSPGSAPGEGPPNRRGRDDRRPGHFPSDDFQFRVVVRLPVFGNSVPRKAPHNPSVDREIRQPTECFACTHISCVPFVTSDPKGLCIHGSGKVSEESRNETAWPAEDDDHAQSGARAGP